MSDCKLQHSSAAARQLLIDGHKQLASLLLQLASLQAQRSAGGAAHHSTAQHSTAQHSLAAARLQAALRPLPPCCCGPSALPARPPLAASCRPPRHHHQHPRRLASAQAAGWRGRTRRGGPARPGIAPAPATSAPGPWLQEGGRGGQPRKVGSRPAAPGQRAVAQLLPSRTLNPASRQAATEQLQRRATRTRPPQRRPSSDAAQPRPPTHPSSAPPPQSTCTARASGGEPGWTRRAPPAGRSAPSGMGCTGRGALAAAAAAPLPDPRLPASALPSPAAWGGGMASRRVGEVGRFIALRAGGWYRCREEGASAALQATSHAKATAELLACRSTQRRHANMHSPLSAPPHVVARVARRHHHIGLRHQHNRGRGAAAPAARHLLSTPAVRALAHVLFTALVGKTGAGQGHPVDCRWQKQTFLVLKFAICCPAGAGDEEAACICRYPMSVEPIPLMLIQLAPPPQALCWHAQAAPAFPPQPPRLTAA